MARLYLIVALILALLVAAPARAQRFFLGPTDLTGSCPTVRFNGTLFGMTRPSGICEVTLGGTVFTGADQGCIGSAAGGNGNDFCANPVLDGKTWNFSAASAMTLKSGTIVPGTLVFNGSTSGTSSVQAQAIAGGTASLPVVSTFLVGTANSPLTSSPSAIGTSSSTTDTLFSTATYNIPADTMIVGRSFRVTAWGQMAWGAGVAHVRLRWGTNGAPVSGDPVLVDLTGTPTAGTAKGWHASMIVTTRTTGGSGTMMGGGAGVFANNVVLSDQRTVGAVTVATNAAKTLALFGKFDSANGTNTMTLEGFVVEFLN